MKTESGANSAAAKLTAFVPQVDTSLFRLSAIAVVTRIWSCGSLNAALQSIVDAKRSLSEDCHLLTEKAEGLVRGLGLPTVILDEVLAISEWISHDLILYVNGLIRNEFFWYTGAVGDIIEKVRWEVHGTINEVATFQNMRYVNSHYNYVLSTIFCLEQEVPRLWAECVCGPDMLSGLHSGDFSYAKYAILYWTCRVTQNDVSAHLSRLDDPQRVLSGVPHGSSLDLQMLAVSLHIFNAHAYKYFWRRLDADERRAAFSVLCATYAAVDDQLLEPEEDYLLRHSVSIVLFTLLQLDEQQRLLLVRRCYYQLIVQFWQYWPVHQAILPLFQAVVATMDQATYCKLFANLLANVGPYTPKGRLLYEMWRSSPPHLRKHIADDDRQRMLHGAKSTAPHVPATNYRKF